MTPDRPSSGPPRTRTFGEFENERKALSAVKEQKEASLSGKVERLHSVLVYEQHPLFLLPEGADEALQDRQRVLQQNVSLFTDRTQKLMAGFSPAELGLVDSVASTLLAELDTYERDCTDTARTTLGALMKDPAAAKFVPVLGKELGISGSEEGFASVVEALTAPLPGAPADAPDLQKSHQSLRMRQYQLIDSVFNLSLLNMRDAELYPTVGWEKGLSAADRANALRTLGSFLMQRRVYEGAVRKKPEKEPSKALLYLGVAAQEVAEEGGESIKFGKSVVRAPEWMRTLDTSLRAKMLTGYEGASKMIGAKAPTLSAVISSVDKSPVGREFWKNMFAVESPVTVMLYMMYVHQSDNKLKASMMFASYMATSAASGAMLEVSANVLSRTRLASLARLPKNPVIQFTAALLIAFGLSHLIDRLVTSVDESIPDGPVKGAANDVLDVVSGGTILDSSKFLLGEVGMPGMQVHPERDAFSYLSQQLLTLRSRKGSRPSLAREKMNGINDWNAQVDHAIAVEWNPLARKLFQLEKADTGAWSDRQAFMYAAKVQFASQLEQGIGSQLADRQILPDARSLDFVHWATADDTDESPDAAVKRMEDDRSMPQGKAKAYIDSITSSKAPEDVQLVSAWKTYRGMTDKIARDTAVFKHLGLYNKKEWVGEKDHASLTPKAQKGIAAEITRLAERDDILQARNEGKAERAVLARNMTSLVKHEKITHDVKNVLFSSLFTPDGKIVDMRSHFYKRSLMAAAEAAALALPPDHDINLLFAELRQRIATGQEVSREEMMKIRDRFVDAVRQESETTSSYKKVLSAEAQMFPIPRQHLYTSLQIDPEAVRDFRDHKMPDEWPYILLQKAFQAPMQQELAAGHADIVLLQEVLPAWDKRSHYRLNILTMTCIECKGPDPSQWIVRVHRYQTAREIAGLKHEIQSVADVGGTSQMNFTEWSRMHPKAATTIAPSVETMKGGRK